MAEVTNTPWGERHVYVVEPDRAGEGDKLQAGFSKALHVSPFMTMDMEYRLSATVPGENLDVRMVAVRDACCHLFEAALSLRRRPMTARALNGALIRYPFMTARVTATIYWQALRLRLKGVPFVPHPGRSAPSSDRTPETAGLTAAPTYFFDASK